jgi:hypothetical protein
MERTVAMIIAYGQKDHESRYGQDHQRGAVRSVLGGIQRVRELDRAFDVSTQRSSRSR